jgi:hypothetical protein
MQMITRMTTEADINSFLKHVGTVRTADNQPLRKGNLEQHVAKLLGVCDWNTALGMVRKSEGTNAPACAICHQSLMPNGFCPDMLCFYHEWPQAAEVKVGMVNRRLTVKAGFESDDGRFKTDFDATPYFDFLVTKYRDISSSIISAIIIESGSGCIQADDVARSFTDEKTLLPYAQFPGYSAIIAAFHHFDSPYADNSGFEVYVDIEDLGRWLESEHPDVLKDLDDMALNELGME